MIRQFTDMLTITTGVDIQKISSSKKLKFVEAEPTNESKINMDILSIIYKICVNLMYDINLAKVNLQKKLISQMGTLNLSLIKVKDQEIDDNSKIEPPVNREILLKHEDLELDEELEEVVIDSPIRSDKSSLKYEDVFLSLKKIFDLLVTNFLSCNLLKQKTFGLDNILKVETITLILEIFVNMNFILMKLEKEKEHYDQIPSMALNVSPNANLKLSMSFDDKFKQNVQSPLLDDKQKLCNFLNYFYDCIVKFDKNTIFHQEAQYFFSLVVSDYSPTEIVDTFLDSNIIEMIIETFLNRFYPMNIANLCKIAVTIFTSSNEKIVNKINKGKFKTYNNILKILTTVYGQKSFSALY